MNYLLSLMLLLLVGRFIGITCQRYGFQSIIGEVMGGIILGPLAFLITMGQYGIETTEHLKIFSEFGILMLMLLLGLKTDFQSFKDNMKGSFIVGCLGAFASFIIIFFPLYLIGFDWMAALFIAAILSNTAIEVCGRLLLDSDEDPKFKSVAIGASFVDDILAVFIIGLVTSVVFKGQTNTFKLFGWEIPVYDTLLQLLIIGIIISIFVIISLYVATKLIEKVFTPLIDIARREKILLTATILVTCIFSLIASGIWLHEVIGAYIAGLVIGKWGSKIDPMLKRRISFEHLVSDIDPPLRGIFSPLFFGYVGLMFVFPAGENAVAVLALIVFLLLLAIGGKIVGCGAGAKLCGFSNAESMNMGITMCGRGALEFVLIVYGLEVGIINGNQFTALVMVTILTIILTPILYTSFKKVAKKSSE